MEEPQLFPLVQSSCGTSTVGSNDLRNISWKASLSDKTLDNHHEWRWRVSRQQWNFWTWGWTRRSHRKEGSSGSETSRSNKLANHYFFFSFFFLFFEWEHRTGTMRIFLRLYPLRIGKGRQWQEYNFFFKYLKKGIVIYIYIYRKKNMKSGP